MHRLEHRGALRSGLMLAEAAKPRPPWIAAPRSVRMSPKRFEATTTSRLSGAMHHAGGHRVDVVARDLDVRIVGSDPVGRSRPRTPSCASGRSTSSPRRACRAARRACSKPKRRMRSTPCRVKIAVSTATSSGVPTCTRPPAPEYSPSVFSRTQRMSKSVLPQRALDARAAGGAGGCWRTGRRPCGSAAAGRAARRNRALRGPADRAEEDRVEAAQDVDAVGGHHGAGGEAGLAGPVEARDLQPRPARRRDGRRAASVTSGRRSRRPGITAIR